MAAYTRGSGSGSKFKSSLNLMCRWIFIDWVCSLNSLFAVVFLHHYFSDGRGGGGYGGMGRYGRGKN